MSPGVALLKKNWDQTRPATGAGNSPIETEGESGPEMQSDLYHSDLL